MLRRGERKRRGQRGMMEFSKISFYVMTFFKYFLLMVVGGVVEGGGVGVGREECGIKGNDG